ncbi:hypothetical protein FH972_023212 [Carpinus fangiana]|uniref:Uncharacterized protein n=1 Tax=Carpinus fangiana TaxID=176857 RepID=A0A5N6KUJ3_9ROSI|nr:hypothetical protein FH972_023212 [Carpinus fangiana]
MAQIIIKGASKLLQDSRSGKNNLCLLAEQGIGANDNRAATFRLSDTCTLKESCEELNIPHGRSASLRARLLEGSSGLWVASRCGARQVGNAVNVNLAALGRVERGAKVEAGTLLHARSHARALEGGSGGSGGQGEDDGELHGDGLRMRIDSIWNFGLKDSTFVTICASSLALASAISATCFTERMTESSNPNSSCLTAIGQHISQLNPSAISDEVSAEVNQFSRAYRERIHQPMTRSGFDRCYASKRTSAPDRTNLPVSAGHDRSRRVVQAQLGKMSHLGGSSDRLSMSGQTWLQKCMRVVAPDKKPEQALIAEKTNQVPDVQLANQSVISTGFDQVVHPKAASCMSLEYRAGMTSVVVCIIFNVAAAVQPVNVTWTSEGSSKFDMVREGLHNNCSTQDVKVRHPCALVRRCSARAKRSYQ